MGTSILLPVLEAWVATIFQRAGLDEGSAALAATRLILADITGARTHGIARLPSYWRQLTRGGLNPRPNIRHTWQGTVVALFPEIRRRGVVMDANGIIDGATGIASPCFDETGHASCAVTIAGPTARLLATRERIEQLALKAAEQISQILGARGPYPPPERAAVRDEAGGRRRK